MLILQAHKDIRKEKCQKNEKIRIKDALISSMPSSIGYLFISNQHNSKKKMKKQIWYKKLTNKSAFLCPSAVCHRHFTQKYRVDKDTQFFSDIPIFCVNLPCGAVRGSLRNTLCSFRTYSCNMGSSLIAVSHEGALFFYFKSSCKQGFKPWTAGERTASAGLYGGTVCANKLSRGKIPLSVTASE